MKLQLRRPAAPDHLDVAPQHALRWPVPSAFIAASFAANRPAKWIAGSRRRVQYAISPSVKMRLQEPIAVALDRRGDARDVGGVEAEADDVGH